MPDEKDDPRIVLTIEPATSAKEKVELALRLMLAGDFSKKKAGTHDKPLKERETIVIENKRDWTTAMGKINPKLSLTVPSRIKSKDKYLTVDLEFKEMPDFTPDRIVEQVPALEQLLAARRKIETMGRMVTDPVLRELLQEILLELKKGNKDNVNSLLSKLGSSPEAADKQESSKGNQE